MKRLLTTLTTILAFGMLTVALPDIAFAEAAKVDVCHIPPGNPDNFHTIRISENALAAHLAHGDFASACNDICTSLCDDEDACTVDDTLDCEENGCPPFPRDPVDSSDGLACTVDSCDSAGGISNTPVLCQPSDLCHVSKCVEPGGECQETEKICPNGCDLNTGACLEEGESICGIPKPLNVGLCLCGFPEIECSEPLQECQTANDCNQECTGLPTCVLPGEDFPAECGPNNEAECFYIEG